MDDLHGNDLMCVSTKVDDTALDLQKQLCTNVEGMAIIIKDSDEGTRNNLVPDKMKAVGLLQM